MISLCLVPFVFAALVSAAVEEHNEIFANKDVGVSSVEADGADLISNQAVASTQIQSSQKDKDGFGGKKKLSLALAAALGVCLATLLLLRRSQGIGFGVFGKSVHEDDLSEEVGTSGRYGVLV
ncbi:hypothetical protein cyc_00018 [Cyclospora cayetanensis]|uniref:Transmembrane protein n=1 Tax=Cyclospora cayetanensis TaxID=88456 RepID=A0A1D3CSC7_9EIME|nr:hypothetical protein cyc_00018 [Cyclospora cayetanensis]